MNPELTTLRGLHLPTGGGSVLQGEIVAAIALGFAAALIVGLARILRARMRSTVRRAALRELAVARNLAPQARLTEQARLLRRVVRTIAGEEAASTRGTAWAQKLDGTFATDFFSRGAGQAFVDGLYRRPVAADPAAIDAELARLFSRIKA
ncbi:MULTISPECIES: DUF4381 domain-containing protein [Methylobacterium]|uniref:DUF4381 domain-containing protein n=1 Tax=Methylobacterium thuringiense TaxID=1003091 RepID=A0ABQ4TIP9_9HYPH|nr:MULTISPECIES: DUF4381 domain-containing protein [Methylobacterium]TXN22599.1 DUF4381 domain-containing protein [Methylobacterium sp. WL9]GJE54079.1 hypothetical protein EKPJFOCH_0551 [Methylobacterium thuringiense]